MNSKIFLIATFLFWSCTDDENINNYSSTPWTITWETEQNSASGILLFTSENELEIIIENPDQFFFNQSESVYYYYQKTERTLTLSRKDNQFSMSYDIIEETPNHFLLQYEDDLHINISH